MLKTLLILPLQALALDRLGVANLWLVLAFFHVLGHLNVPLWARTEPRVQMISVNLGGCFLPLVLAGLKVSVVGWLEFFSLLMLVSVVANRASVLLPGRGVAMVPIAPALTAALLCGNAELAYTVGCLGVLVGADLTRIRRMLREGTDLIGIGEAGGKDGILVTGMTACLLS